MGKMEWITLATAIIEILKYLDSQKKKPKKLTSAKVKQLAAVNKKTQKAVAKAEAMGALPNLVWTINWLLSLRKKK